MHGTIAEEVVGLQGTAVDGDDITVQVDRGDRSAAVVTIDGVALRQPHGLPPDVIGDSLARGLGRQRGQPYRAAEVGRRAAA